VHDENLHIEQHPRGKYPDPDIPADTAWNDMNLLLDAQLPPSDIPSQKGKMNWGSRGFWYSAMVITGIAGSIVWYVLNSKDEQFVKQEKLTGTSIDSTQTLSQPQHNIPISSDPSETVKYADVVKSSESEDVPGKNESVPNEDKAAPMTVLPVSSGNQKTGTDTSFTSENENIKLENPEPDFQHAVPQKGDTTSAVPESVESKEIKYKEASENKGSDFGKNILGTGKTSGSKESKRIAGQRFFENTHFGLQWNSALPWRGTEGYFRGPNGKTEIWRPLIPGIWLSRKWGKHEIGLRFNPVSQTFTGNKFISSIETNFPADSMGNKNLKSTFQNKSFGMSGGLIYHFEIFPSFVTGLGVDCHTQTRSVLSYRITTGSSGSVSSETSFTGIGKSDNDWILHTVFFTGNLELAWRQKQFDLGADFKIPLTTLTNVPGSTLKPVNGELFFRWKIR
jgi:hypothetical protein